MDLRMGQPTLDAWKIILVGVWLNEAKLRKAKGRRASLRALAERQLRRSGTTREREPKWFPSIVERYLILNSIGIRSERRELKHLSTCRKGHQPRLRK
jgi:hypothetical protein